MAQVGSSSVGKVLIGTGSGASPTFASIGTNSGLTAHSVVIAEGNGAFAVASPGNVGYVLTSNGALADPSFQPVAGAIDETLTGNSGVATATGNNINVVTANSTVKFVGSVSTLTQDFDVAPHNTVLGNSLTSLTSGAQNTGLGGAALQHVTSSSANTCVGYQSGNAITSGTGGNCFFGWDSGLAVTTSPDNIAIGQQAMTALTTGTGRNIAIGSLTLPSLTGSYNIAIGYNAGNDLSNAETSNIAIGHIGSNGVSNTTWIGTQGTGAGQQSRCFIAGVLNTSSGRVVNITSPGSYPYTTLTTDYVILVDTTSARTIVPLASPVTGTTYRIKDNVGSAASNNITITPSGNNIDGAASTVINVAYGSVDICFNGTQWNIL